MFFALPRHWSSGGGFAGDDRTILEGRYCDAVLAVSFLGPGQKSLVQVNIDADRCQARLQDCVDDEARRSWSSQSRLADCSGQSLEVD